MRTPPANPRKFQPGQSGNPGGRPKIPPHVREAARALTPEAINTLHEIMRDRRAPHASRVAAANSILDRAWGKAPQHITTERMIEQLSDQELVEELEAVLTELRAMGSEVVSHYEIEGTEETEEGSAAQRPSSVDRPKKH